MKNRVDVGALAKSETHQLKEIAGEEIECPRIDLPNAKSPELNQLDGSA